MYMFNIVFPVLCRSSTYSNPLNEMVYLHPESGLRVGKKSIITMRLWRCVFTHQLGICRRLFHWSVSGRWSCSGRDCGGGRKGHKAGCTRGHWRREDRCRRTPQVCLTPDTELHLDRAQNHTHSHPLHSPHLSSVVSKNTLDTPERRYGTVRLKLIPNT